VVFEGVTAGRVITRCVIRGGISATAILGMKAKGRPSGEDPDGRMRVGGHVPQATRVEGGFNFR